MTIFTIRKSERGFSAHTLDTENGCTGGFCYVKTEIIAVDLAYAAYPRGKEVDNATYKDALRRSQRVEVEV
jgi:hypothetical protein